MNPSHRVPSLDFLRALAIGLVVTAHTVLAYGPTPALKPLQRGGTGVVLFFLLSGWLLGGQLFRELKRRRSIDLPRFWYRRWLRTLPAYYAVLFLTFLQQCVATSSPNIQWQYLLFLQNYFPMPYFTISWSLCVEEHFYLLIGPVLLLMFFYPRWRAPTLLAVFGIPILCRSMGWYGSLVETHVRWDVCAAGVGLAAIAEFAPEVWSRLCRFSPWAAAAGLAAYLLDFAVRWHPTLPAVRYDQAIYSLIFGSFLVLAVSSEPWGHRLTMPGAAYLASRAYSIYLLHAEVLAVMKRYGKDLSFPVYLLVTWIGCCLVAEVLYRLVELPGMNLRERLPFMKTSPQTSETKLPPSAIVERTV